MRRSLLDTQVRIVCPHFWLYKKFTTFAQHNLVFNCFLTSSIHRTKWKLRHILYFVYKKNSSLPKFVLTSATYLNELIKGWLKDFKKPDHEFEISEKVKISG